MEIIVHDVNEERGLHEVGDEFLRGRIILVEFGPLGAQFEGLILEERNGYGKLIGDKLFDVYY